MNYCDHINLTKQSGIYKIICLVNGKIYIGSAKNIKERFKLHLIYLNKNKHKNSHLQYAFNLYGEKNFIFTIIEFVNIENLIEREQYWLDATKCYDRTIGFNICLKANSSLGVKRTPEFKEKIRLQNLNRDKETKERTIAAVKKANTGRKGWNRGIKMWETRTHPRGGLGKKYPNRILTPEGYKKRCIANRRDRGEKYKELRRLIKSKTHYFITPDGKEIVIFNLKLFCAENNLNQGHMNQVSIGNEPIHKGWTKNKNYALSPPLLKQA
jgi:group I intron endonuclease